jgi:hypothetical protein
MMFIRRSGPQPATMNTPTGGTRLLLSVYEARRNVDMRATNGKV